MQIVDMQNLIGIPMVVRLWKSSTTGIHHQYTRFKAIYIVVIVLFASGCESFSNPHEIYLRDSLARVTYDNGISLSEAKAIADAYLYLYASKPGKIRHARIQDGQDRWLAKVYGGTGISPTPVDLPDVEINKQTGEITWAAGPTVQNILLSQPG